MFHKLHIVQWCAKLHLPEWCLAAIIVLFLGGCEFFVHRLFLPNLFSGTTYIAMPFITDHDVPLTPNTRPDGTRYTNLTIEQYTAHMEEAFFS